MAHQRADGRRVRPGKGERAAVGIETRGRIQHQRLPKHHVHGCRRRCQLDNGRGIAGLGDRVNRGPDGGSQQINRPHREAVQTRGKHDAGERPLLLVGPRQHALRVPIDNDREDRGRRGAGEGNRRRSGCSAAAGGDGKGSRVGIHRPAPDTKVDLLFNAGTTIRKPIGVLRFIRGIGGGGGFFRV